jgi:hypothetical protein
MKFTSGSAIAGLPAKRIRFEKPKNVEYIMF